MLFLHDGPDEPSSPDMDVAKPTNATFIISSTWLQGIKTIKHLSIYLSIYLGLVFYVLKSLLGITSQWSREKFAIVVCMLDIKRSY